MENKTTGTNKKGPKREKREFKIINNFDDFTEEQKEEMYANASIRVSKLCRKWGKNIIGVNGE